VIGEKRIEEKKGEKKTISQDPKEKNHELKGHRGVTRGRNREREQRQYKTKLKQTLLTRVRDKNFYCTKRNREDPAFLSDRETRRLLTWRRLYLFFLFR